MGSSHSVPLDAKSVQTRLTCADRLAVLCFRHLEVVDGERKKEALKLSPQTYDLIRDHVHCDNHSHSAICFPLEHITYLRGHTSVLPLILAGPLQGIYLVARLWIRETCFSSLRNPPIAKVIRYSKRYPPGLTHQDGMFPKCPVSCLILCWPTNTANRIFLMVK